MPRLRTPGEDDIEGTSPVDLSALDQDFSRLPPKTTPRPVPDGRYLIEVEAVELTRARTSLRPILKWKLRILGPFGAGGLIYKNNSLSTTDNLRWLKHDLGVCGLELDKLSDLPSHLARLLHLEIEVTKRTKGDFDNVYFERCTNPVSADGNRLPPF